MLWHVLWLDVTQPRCYLPLHQRVYPNYSLSRFESTSSRRPLAALKLGGAAFRNCAAPFINERLMGRTEVATRAFEESRAARASLVSVRSLSWDQSVMFSRSATNRDAGRSVSRQNKVGFYKHGVYYTVVSCAVRLPAVVVKGIELRLLSDDVALAWAPLTTIGRRIKQLSLFQQVAFLSGIAPAILTFEGYVLTRVLRLCLPQAEPRRWATEKTTLCHLWRTVSGLCSAQMEVATQIHPDPQKVTFLFLVHMFPPQRNIIT